MIERSGDHRPCCVLVVGAVFWLLEWHCLRLGFTQCVAGGHWAPRESLEHMQDMCHSNNAHAGAARHAQRANRVLVYAAVSVRIPPGFRHAETCGQEADAGARSLEGRSGGDLNALCKGGSV